MQEVTEQVRGVEECQYPGIATAGGETVHKLCLYGECVTRAQEPWSYIHQCYYVSVMLTPECILCVDLC